MKRVIKKDKLYTVGALSVTELKDPNDCHRIPFLDSWLGKRAVIVTSIGTVKGRLEYLDGWYFCQAPFRLVNGNWQFSHYRFCFRKGQFRSIKIAPLETSLGI